jgi:anion-transporting  ArsA/GET3 family ATPase
MGDHSLGMAQLKADGSLASQKLSRLVIDSASTVRSLAFLPTNPAHEEIVDRLTAHRLSATTSRKLIRAAAE